MLLAASSPVPRGKLFRETQSVFNGTAHETANDAIMSFPLFSPAPIVFLLHARTLRALSRAAYDTRNDSGNSHRAGLAGHRPCVRLQSGHPKGILWIYPRVGICSARNLRIRAGVKRWRPAIAGQANIACP